MMKRAPQKFSQEIEFTRYSRPLAWGGKEPKSARLSVSLPRGKVATLEFDWQTQGFITNHDVLFTPFFHKGVIDFEGFRRIPSEGYEFLSALHDHLHLTGYSVTWTWVSPSPQAEFSE